jgi:Holliday junction resolvase
MTYYAKRVDSNQKDIVQAFKELGCSVLDLSRVGQGCPDLLIGYKNKCAMVEIKSSNKAHFTEPQLKFIKNWKGSSITRIDSVEGVIRLVKLLDNVNH